MINSLSDKQISKMETYVDKWLKIGLSTEPFTKEEATNIINDIYQVNFNKDNPTIIIKESPLAVWQYIQEVCNQKMDFVWSYFVGSFDTNIFAFYDYCIEELGVSIQKDLLKKYKSWRESSKLGLIYPFDDVCVISEKPVSIVRKGNMIHNDNGPAIMYRDGFSVYILNGVRMTKEYVETPWNEIDPITVMKETNAEVRRELVRKIGIERLVDKIGATCIDTDGDYELLLLDIGDGLKRPYLKMKNPSIGVYHIEGVHPDCKTVKDALIFRNGGDETPEVLT